MSPPLIKYNFPPPLNGDGRNLQGTSYNWGITSSPPSRAMHISILNLAPPF